jgi:hypothetical protein
MVRSVVRAAALPPPRRINDESFSNICHDFGIVERRHQEVRVFLDDCATAFAEVIRTRQGLPTRRDDRLNIERAARDIRNASRLLNQAKGPAARSRLRAAGTRIGPLVSAPWLRWKFPNDPNAPPPRYWNDSSARSPVSGLPIDVEDISLYDRISFATRRSHDVIAAVLAELAQALDDARQRIVELPDGRKPLETRNYLMAALAQLWGRLGRRPTPGRRSNFGQFCEDIFIAIGWPAQGVNAALPDAIAMWRQLYGSPVPK